jgi:hypothetical protein
LYPWSRTKIEENFPVIHCAFGILSNSGNLVPLEPNKKLAEEVREEQIRQLMNQKIAADQLLQRQQDALVIF